jgi:hypothetical protein
VGLGPSRVKPKTILLVFVASLLSRDRMAVGFTTTCAISVTTEIVSLTNVHGKVYSIQHYMIKFVSDLRQVVGFLRVPPPITRLVYGL